jgi:Ser/Thr protein kinase RdoA (MazF antagonist)
MTLGSFDGLAPQLTVQAVESSHGVVLDGTLEPYPSYVNRVYGVRTEDGAALVAKFYRPGRWSREAILDEHRFLADLAAAEVPVVAPIAGLDGATLHEVAADGAGDGDGGTIPFAVFPRVGGRTFEPETDDDYRRLGALVGRCHAVAARGTAPHRVACEPATLTASFIDELLEADLVHPDCRPDFERIARATVARIAPLFAGVPAGRIHGDCHRGNLLDRPGAGLALIDFDDMMTGPAVQDAWLLLPGYAADCARELEALLEGYASFAPFDRATLRLVEPLRFMRMIYFLAWRARQRDDHWFRGSFPDWGTEAFWITETEDLRVQAAVIGEALEA